MSLLALTDAQISTWVASFMLPLIRVGALLTTMPIIGTTLVPKRIKLFLSLAITLAIMPSLPPLPVVNPLDLSGLMLIAEQIIIGALLGFRCSCFSRRSWWPGKLSRFRWAWALRPWSIRPTALTWR